MVSVENLNVRKYFIESLDIRFILFLYIILDRIRLEKSIERI